jgi:P22 coat protein - gene protein 5
VTADVTANQTTTNTTGLVVSPPMIVTGPYQTVTYSGNLDTQVIVQVGSAGTTYRQNLFYHKNAMALAVVPMEMPQGAIGGARRSYKGLSVRVQPYYDGVNDVSKWRLDLLYGRALIDPRLAVRSSGT